MSKFRPTRGVNGEYHQAGLPKNGDVSSVYCSYGLLIRGVVLNTYVYDDNVTPTSSAIRYGQSAVYCDVLTYSGITGSRYNILPKCLVKQERTGMHDGEMWIPRPTSMDITGQAVSFNSFTRPSDMDGDHVLVGFIDNEITMPIIIGSVPHPNSDAGNGLPSAVDVTGHRLKLIKADGQPRFTRHRGTYWGVSPTGDFIADSSRANSGIYTPVGGAEPDNVAGYGDQLYRLPSNQTWTVEIVQNSDNPSTKLSQIQMQNGQLAVSLTDGDLNVSNVNTNLNSTGDVNLGSGASHPLVLGDLLQTAHTTKDTAIITFLTGLGTALGALDTAINVPIPATTVSQVVGALTAFTSSVTALIAPLAAAVTTFDSTFTENLSVTNKTK